MGLGPHLSHCHAELDLHLLSLLLSLLLLLLLLLGIVSNIRRLRAAIGGGGRCRRSAKEWKHNGRGGERNKETRERARSKNICRRERCLFTFKKGFPFADK
jgi:hypothetical protein